MKLKKKKKSVRMMGTNTYGRGFKKKGRGKGHRGGRGMSGTGKRADQKKTLILNLPEDYFGKKGLRAKKKRYEVINLSEIEKLSKGKKELDLGKYKILGKGVIKNPISIKAYSASKSAVSKIEKVGGKLTLKINPEKSDEAL
ncbi:MAG TPA: uL15m family ribosomal protein [Candidatus Nanoarchaeia archaeon]|nr:uL15m family ribosomal protein [Candidatus Nanoarchaeia archaeon]